MAEGREQATPADTDTRGDAEGAAMQVRQSNGRKAGMHDSPPYLTIAPVHLIVSDRSKLWEKFPLSSTRVVKCRSKRCQMPGLHHRGGTLRGSCLEIGRRKPMGMGLQKALQTQWQVEIPPCHKTRADKKADK